MKRGRARLQAILTFGVVLLLTSAARGPAPAVPNAASLPGLDLYVPLCSTPLQSGGSDSAWTANFGDRFIQPIGPLGDIAEADLDLVATDFASGRFQIVEWDPVALAPDPTSIALRSRDFWPSSLSRGGPRVPFDPPIVLRTLAGVAEAPRPTVAIDYTLKNYVYYGGTPQNLLWTPDGSPAAPAAYREVEGAFVGLPGDHPVLGHAICGASEAIQGFSVCQSVTRCDTLIGATTGTLAQRFRVPETVQLRWLELALGNNQGNHYPSWIGVFDADGDVLPPASTEGALVASQFYNPEVDSWGTHFEFNTHPVLLANHDYWILFGTTPMNTAYARRLTGLEGPGFAGIGDLWTQAVGGIWSQDPNHVLAFKVIGEALSQVSIDAPGVARSGSLQLTASPNPSKGAPVIRWAGARGAVRFEVFDASGRRVAEDRFDTADGRWTWRAQGAFRRSGPGLYFVRAVDAAGQRATLRLGLIR